MKIKLKVILTYDIAIMAVSAGVRYWEDATVNGVVDEDGTLIPFRNGDNWEPQIDVNTGTIIGWPEGTTANIHYKVCDCFSFQLKDSNGVTRFKEDDVYVPNDLIPGEFGDYIIMEVDGNGKIKEWDFNFAEYHQIDED